MSLDNPGPYPLSSACEIIKDKFYFLTFQNVKLKSTPEVYYFCTDDQFVYRNYNQDFGPLNLAMVCRYCTLVSKKMETFQTLGRKLCHVTSEDPRKRTNAAFLVGCFAVLLNGKSPEETVRCLITQPKVPLYLPFRDVSVGPSLYNLGLLDCFKALVKARSLGLFDVYTFDVAQYEYLEKMVNGDINWIIPGKFLALPGPLNKSYSEKGFPSHTPSFYIPYFLENNVTTVIRLNKDLYQSRKFSDCGINHFDIYFPDGSVPPLSLVERFIDICEKAPGAIAVHCKAGLGRTGTMIGCYMIKNMKFTAAEAIAWIRMARPGSIIGMQQIFLNDIQKYLWMEGSKIEQQEKIQLPAFSLPTPTQQISQIQQMQQPQQLQQNQSQLQQLQQMRATKYRSSIGNRLSYPTSTRIPQQPQQQQQQQQQQQHQHQQQQLQHHQLHRQAFKPSPQYNYRQRMLSLNGSDSKTVTQGDILNQLKAKKQNYPKDAATYPQGPAKLSLWPGPNADLGSGPSEIGGVTKDMFNTPKNLKLTNDSHQRKMFESVQDILKNKAIFPKKLFNNNNMATRPLRPCNKEVRIPTPKVSHNPIRRSSNNLIKIQKIHPSELSGKATLSRTKLRGKTREGLRSASKRKLVSRQKRIINNENIISDPQNIKQSSNLLEKIDHRQLKSIPLSNVDSRKAVRTDVLIRLPTDGAQVGSGRKFPTS